MESDNSSDGWITDSDDEKAPKTEEFDHQNNQCKHADSDKGESKDVPWTSQATVEKTTQSPDGEFVITQEVKDEEPLCERNSFAFDASQSHEGSMTIKKEEVDQGYLVEPPQYLAMTCTGKDTGFCTQSTVTSENSDVQPSTISTSFTANTPHSSGRNTHKPNVQTENSMPVVDQFVMHNAHESSSKVNKLVSKSPSSSDIDGSSNATTGSGYSKRSYSSTKPGRQQKRLNTQIGASFLPRSTSPLGKIKGMTCDKIKEITCDSNTRQAVLTKLRRNASQKTVRKPPVFRSVDECIKFLPQFMNEKNITKVVLQGPKNVIADFTQKVNQKLKQDKAAESKAKTDLNDKTVTESKQKAPLFSSVNECVDSLQEFLNENNLKKVFLRGPQNDIADFALKVNERLNQQKATVSSAKTDSYDNTGALSKQNALDQRTSVANDITAKIFALQIIPPHTEKPDANKVSTVKSNKNLQSVSTSAIPASGKLPSSQVTAVESDTCEHYAEVKTIIPPYDRKRAMPSTTAGPNPSTTAGPNTQIQSDPIELSANGVTTSGADKYFKSYTVGANIPSSCGTNYLLPASVMTVHPSGIIQSTAILNEFTTPSKNPSNIVNEEKSQLSVESTAAAMSHCEENQPSRISSSAFASTPVVVSNWKFNYVTSNMKAAVTSVPHPVMGVESRTNLLRDRCPDSKFTPPPKASSVGVPTVPCPPKSIRLAVAPEIDDLLLPPVHVPQSVRVGTMISSEPSQSNNRSTDGCVRPSSNWYPKPERDGKVVGAPPVTSNVNVPIVFQTMNGSVVCNIFVADDGKCYLVPRSQNKDDKKLVKVREVTDYVLDSGVRVKTEIMKPYEVSAPSHLANSIVKLNEEGLNLHAPSTEGVLKVNVQDKRAGSESQGQTLRPKEPSFVNPNGTPLVFRKVNACTSGEDTISDEGKKQIKLSHPDSKAPDSAAFIVHRRADGNGSGHVIRSKIKFVNKFATNITRSKADLSVSGKDNKAHAEVSEGGVGNITRGERVQPIIVTKPDEQVSELVGKLSPSNSLPQSLPLRDGQTGNKYEGVDTSVRTDVNDVSEQDAKRSIKEARKRSRPQSLPPMKKTNLITENKHGIVTTSHQTGEGKTAFSSANDQKHAKKETISRKRSSHGDVKWVTVCNNPDVDLAIRLPRHHHPAGEQRETALMVPDDVSAILALRNAAEGFPKVVIKKVPSELHVNQNNDDFDSALPSVVKEASSNNNSCDQDDGRELVATTIEDRKAELPQMPEDASLPRTAKMCMLQKRIEEQEKNLEEMKKNLQEFRFKRSNLYLSENY